MQKFKQMDGDYGYGYAIYERTLVGRITPKRWAIVRNYVKRYNHENKYPYGVSRNGYAYRCGCSHDCCGCLVRTSMDIIPNAQTISIRLYQSFNY
jgi:hypothetical protein